LEWSGSKDWRIANKEVWKEAGRIKGWVKRFKNFIFVVVKGAGHYTYAD
jgi:hypothetical protein